MSGNGSGDVEFDEFEASGEVEVGQSEEKAAIEKTKDGVKADTDDEEEKSKKAPPADDDEGDDEGDDEKPKKSAKDHQIERLKREKKDLLKQIREGGSSQLASRLEALEKRLTEERGGDTKTAGDKAPDPTDLEKYPLGHLDDRYIEDKLEWLAEQKAAKQADAVLQRQQESEQEAAAREMREALLEQVDEISSKGSEIYENFQEDVVETGMRGEWKLGQPTFEAAAEADNGAQILYELSQDKKEAARVAALSSFKQLKYVQERDAEISSGKKGRTKPQAGEPPKNPTKGASSKSRINPATDNLDDFEKAWEADEKASRH